MAPFAGVPPEVWRNKDALASRPTDAAETAFAPLSTVKRCCGDVFPTPTRPLSSTRTRSASLVKILKPPPLVAATPPTEPVDRSCEPQPEPPVRKQLLREVSHLQL